MSEDVAKSRRIEARRYALASERPNDNPALHQGVIWACLEPTGAARADRSTRPEVEVRSLGSPRVREVEPAAEPAAVIAEAHEAGDEAAIVVEELEPVEAWLEDEAPEAFEDAALEREAPAPRVSEIVLAAPPAEGLGAALEDEALMTAAFEQSAANDLVARDASAPPSSPDDPFALLVATLADVAAAAGDARVAAALPAIFDGRAPEPLDPVMLEALSASGLADGGAIAPSFVATARAWGEILRGNSDDFSACGAAMLDEWASEVLAKLLGAPEGASSLRQELRRRGVVAFGLVDAA